MNSITPKSLTDIQRREVARSEMQSYSDYGLFRYVLRSKCVRHVIQPDGLTLHSVIDVLNIVDGPKYSDLSKWDARYTWRDMKRRLKRDDIQMWEQVSPLKLPSWNDGKSYKTDVMETGWLFFLITGVIRSDISNRIRAAFAEKLNRFEREHHAAIISELDREIGWAGTENHLLMAENYEPGDYDLPDGEWWQQ
jgi:hypothetical protein